MIEPRECPHCGSRNIAELTPDREWECHDCGETFDVGPMTGRATTPSPGSRTPRGARMTSPSQRSRADAARRAGELVSRGWVRAVYAGPCSGCGQQYPTRALVRVTPAGWQAECCG